MSSFYLVLFSYAVVLVLDLDRFSFFWPTTTVVRLNYFLTWGMAFESDFIDIELEPVVPISHEAGFLKRKPEYWL